MNWNIIKKALSIFLTLIVNHIKNTLWEQLKVALREAVMAFKDTLWDNIKEKAKESAEDAINYIQAFYVDTTLQNKKKAIIDSVVKNIKLPFILKPFRGVIKKVLNDKIDEMVQGLIDKFRTYIA